MSAGPHIERLQSLESELRTGLHQVTREVATERLITRDLVEALHQRFDRFERDVMAELRSIKTLIAGNGHG